MSQQIRLKSDVPKVLGSTLTLPTFVLVLVGLHTFQFIKINGTTFSLRFSKLSRQNCVYFIQYGLGSGLAFRVT